MNRAEAVARVMTLESLVNAHDVRSIAEMYHEDAELRSPAFPLVKGRAAIAEHWKGLFERFPDWSVRVAEILIDGDRLAFVGTAGALDRSGWFGQPPTGQYLEYRAIILLRLQDGQIIRDDRIYDLSNVLGMIEKTRLERDLRQAAEVQRFLLPTLERRSEYCTVMGDSMPCRDLGGDFFEVIDLAGGNTLVALGDVSGKGAAAALVGSLVQGMLNALVESVAEPAEVLNRLNHMLLERRLEPRFVTLFLAILKPDGDLDYANAGHNPPVVVSGGSVERLMLGGIPLGLLPNPNYREETHRLKRGDTLVVFSDGFTEAVNADGEEYGDNRLIASLRSTALEKAPVLLKELFASVMVFSGEIRQSDDITAIVARFGPTSV